MGKFHTIRKISKKCFLVTRSKEFIALKSPIYIGCILLQKANLENLKFHYTVAKPSAYDFPQNLYHLCDPLYKEIIRRSKDIIKSVYLVYSDTDSLCYHIVFRKNGLTHDFVYNNTFLKAFLDRSNFKVLDRECDFRPGLHGKMKLETSDNIPLEAYFISPKVYSIKLKKRMPLEGTPGEANHEQEQFEYKRAAKGCLRSQVAKTLTQDVYRQVYEGISEAPTLSGCIFRYNNTLSGMVTEILQRVALSLRDDKRFWLTKDLSVAYGHLLAYINGYMDGDVICVRGGEIGPGDDRVNQNALASNGDETVPHEDDVCDAELFNALCDLLREAEVEEEDEDTVRMWQNDPFCDGGDGPRIVYGAKGSLASPPQKRKKSTTILDTSLETPKKTKYHQ